MTMSFQPNVCAYWKMLILEFGGEMSYKCQLCQVNWWHCLDLHNLMNLFTVCAFSRRGRLRVLIVLDFPISPIRSATIFFENFNAPHILSFWYSYFGYHCAVSLTTHNNIHGVTSLVYSFLLYACCVFLPLCQYTCAFVF